MSVSEIDIWLASYGGAVDTSLHAAYRSLLDGAERDQEGRFYFARDRRRYLVTRALVRTVLSRYAPSIRPEEWIFATNAHGRPHAVNPAARGLTFNVSHTDGLIALGVTRGRALGVDVESVVRRRAAIGVADRFFAPIEVADLARTPPEERDFRFFEYWTLKESYIKARGMGLSLPLDGFSFRFPDEDTVTLTIDEELKDDPARWQFWQLRPSKEYLVAVCAERLDREATLEVREAVPLRSVDRIQADVLRVSRETSERFASKGA